jgi:hypothetical protein
MNKRSGKRTRSGRRSAGRVEQDRAARVDVISQLQCAAARPRAALLGAAIGGAVPWFARELAHGELPAAWAAGSRASCAAMLLVIVGCCVFSMLTVYKFGLAAFADRRKAVGFVLALEGVMLVSRGATSLWALAILVAINAIANGCIIALAHDATCRRREADARRSATRARSRGAGRSEVDLATAAVGRVRPADPSPKVAADIPVRTWAIARTPRWHDATDAEIVREIRALS